MGRDKTRMRDDGWRENKRRTERKDIFRVEMEAERQHKGNEGGLREKGEEKNVYKKALRQSDSSSPESGFRRSNPSPNMRQKRVDVSASQSGLSAANARKRFTLQGLSNRRSLQAAPAAKEAEVTRPLSASIKSKRHEIKSDPTPFGYEDTLRGAMAAVRKRQSLISSTATAACATSTVPRSTSQPGWAQRRHPSMDTDDFETIPSSAEESSNSSEEEGNNKNGDSSRYRVQLTYQSRDAQDISLGTGDLVQFLEEAESGHW
ncbi:hypothetical protein JOQ06_005739 [Pogonophryne albipinna]|uniref:SH3 domain-containing protein n=1 Tax=Pogonophryne albipinna TaxID=1090488 RepID=A0AAD6BI38_9TELE|nr:hypothetical protein JOQ06_005739 [Pogonophryne albipinna]